MDFLLWGEGFVSTLGYFGVFVVILFFSMGFTLPMPTSALIIFAGALLNPLYVGVVAGVASTIGESVAFGLGLGGRYVLKGSLKKRRKELGYVKKKLERHKYFLPFIAMLPVPSMVVGLSAGMLRYNKLAFVLSVLAGRIVKMLVYAYIGYMGYALFFA